MVKTLKFTQKKFTNSWPRKAKRAPEDVDDAVKHWMIVTWKIARRSMRRAPASTRNKKTNKFPKAPKSRFGTLRTVRRKTSTHFSKTYGQFQWRKGQYSRPGQPPFWHGGTGKATLKWIVYNQLGHGHWKIQPGYLAQRSVPKVPDLHEFGGTVKKLNKAYYDRRGNKIYRRTPNKAVYPKRPFLAPAMQKAKIWLQGRRSRSFIGRVNSIARMKPRKRAAA